MFAASEGQNALWVKGEIFRNLDEVAKSARGELDRSAQHSLFDRIDWFQRTWRLTTQIGSPLVVRARADGHDCWLFLVEASGHARALTSWYSLSFGPVCSGQPDEATKFALLVATARRLSKRVSSITLSPMSIDDAAIVARAFDAARWVAIRDETTVRWTMATGGISFEDYWAARPGELRSTVKRKAAKYGIETKIFNELNYEAWAQYESIYAASWKTEEGSPDFLRDMAVAESAGGTLRLGIASVDGTPVAAQLWTVENGHAIIHKLAYVESAREFSAGSVLSAAMFAHVIDQDRAVLIDFGTGDDAYKADWMETRVPLYTIRLFNPRRPAGLWGAAKAALALVARRGSR